MSVPIHDTNHAAEALAFLTEQFRQAAVLQGFLNAVSVSVQDAEDMLWDVIHKRLLNDSLSGDQLDQIGKIVGEPRNGRGDPTYLAAVRLRIRVNRSQGRAVDIIDVAHLAMKGLTPGPTYLEEWPAGFLVEGWDMSVATATVLPELLKDTKAIATRGELHYSTWVDGNDFEFISRYGGAAGEGTWGSRYDATVGGLLVAGAEI